MKNSPKKTSRTPARKKRGRPKKFTKEDRFFIENDIMGQFAPDYDEKSKLNYNDKNREYLKVTMMAQRGGTVSSEEVDKLYQKQIQEELYQNIHKNRIGAMNKLGFVDKGDEKNIKLDKLLQKIIPNVDKNSRRVCMAEALGKIIPVFAQRFQIDGEGWPTRHSSSLLEIEPYKCIYDRIKTEEEDGHVTFKTALRVAIYTLAWHKIKSSPKTRGSMGMKKKRIESSRKSG